MSMKLFVSFRDDGFWAFDVVAGVFLKHLIDAAQRHLAQQNDPWLFHAVEHWEFNAVIGDCGLFLDDDWSSEQVVIFTGLATAACAQLSQHGAISAKEFTRWTFYDGRQIFPRGLTEVRTDALIRFGHALIDLVNESLAEPPEGTWWFLSTDDAGPTIPRRQ